MKNGNLLQIHHDFQVMIQQGGAQWYCHQKQMENFYKQYGATIERLTNQVLELQKTMMQVDDKGVPKRDEKGQFIFNEGKNMDMYQIEWKRIADGRVSQLSILN